MTASVRVFAEDSVCTLKFNLSYRRIQYASLAVLIAVFGLSLVYNTFVPLVGAVLLLPLAYRASSNAWRFLNSVNEFLPHLESEHEHMAIAEARRRWQAEPKDTEALHRRLCEKHVKTWGNTHALEYKLAEYVRMGLTREESIRKTADEEGIFRRSPLHCPFFAYFSSCWLYGYTLFLSRGNATASLICVSLQVHATNRSTPRPKPECGTEPYLLRSMYHW